MLVRSLPRRSRPSPSPLPRLRNSPGLARTYQSTAAESSSIFQAVPQTTSSSPSRQTRSAHAISNPTLAGIEKRWESMPPQEQAYLYEQLKDRMKVDWHEMTLQEKKAAWWISFGPHGPRAETPPGEWSKVFIYTGVGILASSATYFLAHSFAKPPPRTMTKEWQEATNEYLKKERVNPIYGISSEGYSGKGYVQSKSAKAQGISLEPEE